MLTINTSVTLNFICSVQNFEYMLHTLMERNGLNQSSLAEKLGIKPQSVNQWLKGDTKPGTKTLPKLAEILGVSVDDIISNRVPEQVTLSELGETFTGNIKSVGVSYSELYTQVPFLSAKAQAGLPTMTFENCELRLEETYPVFMPAVVINKRHLVIELIGDSMEPEIKNGAIVLAEKISKNDIRYESGGVYAVMYAHRFVIKRIKTNDLNQNGTLTLWSDNERYGHITVHGEDISCMWKVTMKVQEPVR